VTFHPNPIGCSLDISKCSTAVIPTKMEPQETSANVVTRAEFSGFFKATRPTTNAAIPLKRYVSLSDVSVRVEEPVVIQIEVAARLIEPIARSAKSRGLDLTV
jgi:hypothetical protein